MKNGQCPICNSSDVFKKTTGVWFGNTGLTVNTGGLVTSKTDFESYVCTNCGYFENYFVDKARLLEVQKKWTRVA